MFYYEIKLCAWLIGLGKLHLNFEKEKDQFEESMSYHSF